MNTSIVRAGRWLSALSVLALVACAPMAPTRDVNDVLRQASLEMGSANLKTLRFAAAGTGTTFGQAYRAGMEWPKINITSFSRAFDYDQAAMREESARNRAEVTGGGGIPLMGMGETRAMGFVQGATAWNGTGAAATGAGVALDQRIHDLWTSPHGVLRAAARNKPTMAWRTEAGKSYSAVSFTEPGRFSATVLIGATGLVEKVESRLSNAVLGDVDVVTSYLNYRDFGGVKFPTRIFQEQGGWMVMDLAVSDVTVNNPAGIEMPAQVQGMPERVTSEQAAPGVWFLAGGSHNSVLIEMQDHTILVESPLYDGRAAAVIAEARRLVPGKPLRYVINSHHHFDHAGGLRAAAAEGLTIVASAPAKPFFDRALANPSRINPDMLTRSGRRAEVIAVDGKREFSDATRTVQVSFIEDSVHAQGFMMVYLPKEQILIEADAYTPLPPNAPPPAAMNMNFRNLAENMDKQGLRVERILPLHGRMVPVREFNMVSGRN